jgi:predicted RNase H-like HicB family nuclease
MAYSKRMKKNKRQFTAVYKKSEGWYVGWVEEVPGAVTQGRTLKELKENLKEAVQLVIETNRDWAERESKGGKLTRESIAIPV